MLPRRAPSGTLGSDPSLAPLTPLLIARTQGNPFFLEESVRTLVETEVLMGERGAYRLARPRTSRTYGWRPEPWWRTATSSSRIWNS
jgi:hypothetical protein